MSFFWFLKPTITYSSKINGIITIGRNFGEKALFSGGVTQSGGEIKPMWDFILEDFYAKHHKPRNILVLGVGGGSIFSAIRRHDKKITITGVEIDPVMIHVAKEQFGIEANQKQKIITADAITFLLRQTKLHEYDLIIVDLYIGALNPTFSRRKKFLERLHQVITPKGTILFNAHYQKKNLDEYKRFIKTTQEVFSTVEEVFSYPLNRVLFLEN